MKKVLFVCSGNICRSPTAEGVFRHLVEKEGLSDLIQTDSVGFESYHVGDAPDKRAQRAAAKRGYNLSSLRARTITQKDFKEFDLILAMDRGHLALLNRACPTEYKSRIHLFMKYAQRFTEEEVPDPYYGDMENFEHVLDLVEDAAQGIIEHLKG